MRAYTGLSNLLNKTRKVRRKAYDRFRKNKESGKFALLEYRR